MHRHDNNRLRATRENQVAAPADMIAFADTFLRTSMVRQELDAGAYLGSFGNGASGYTMHGTNGRHWPDSATEAD